MPNLSNSRESPDLVALDAAIRAARLKAGMSQERLALLAEVDRSYLGRVERGDNNVAVLTLSKIAHAMDMSLTNLMSKAAL